MRIFISLVVLLTLATSLDGCGRRGDPQPPSFNQTN